MTTGPELYPPTPITMDGRRREIVRQASSALAGRSPMPRARAAKDFPFSPALRIVSRANPSRGMTRDSIPAAVPTNATCAPGTLATTSRATAIPGYRWPPVPPPAIRTDTVTPAPDKRFRSSPSHLVLRDVQQDTGSKQVDQQRRSAEAQ